MNLLEPASVAIRHASARRKVSKNGSSTVPGDFLTVVLVRIPLENISGQQVAAVHEYGHIIALAQ